MGTGSEMSAGQPAQPPLSHDLLLKPGNRCWGRGLGPPSAIRPHNSLSWREPDTPPWFANGLARWGVRPRLGGGWRDQEARSWGSSDRTDPGTPPPLRPSHLEPEVGSLEVGPECRGSVATAEISLQRPWQATVKGPHDSRLGFCGFLFFFFL